MEKRRKKPKSVQEFSHEDALQKLFGAADRIAEKLTTDFRALMELENDEPFPEESARQIREAIASGLTDWAVRRMEPDLDKYLDEGVRNFLDLFRLGASNPYRDRPWVKGERFSEGMKAARFLIPLRFSRSAVHHGDWPRLREAYRDVLEELQKIQSKKRRSRGNYLLALRETLPGITDRQIEKFSTLKPSDIAAEYVCWKFKLPAGPEALKEYFRVFHKSYGYLDHLVERLGKIK